MRQSTSPPQTTLSERVREAMHAAGMTQAELARRVGIAQPSVNDWLSGKTKRLKLETAVRAAAVLGVRLEWLVWGRGRPREDDHEHDHPSADEGSNGVTIHAALPVVLDAIAMCPHRDELRTLLALLVDHDAPAYRQRLAELLSSFDPRWPNLTTEDKALAARVTKAAQMAESFDVAGVMKQPVKNK